MAEALPHATEVDSPVLEESAEGASPQRPKVLCEVCDNLDYALIPKGDPFPLFDHRDLKGLAHHTTFQGLQRAATAGCGYCVIFRQALIDAYRSRAGWDEDRIVQYHFLRDGAGGGPFLLGRSPMRLSLDERLCGRRTDEDSEFSLVFWRKVELTRDDRGISVQGLGLDVIDEYGLETATIAHVAITSLSGNHARVVGRQVSGKAPLDLCCSWLESCCSSHADCAPVKDSTMPTRLIEVGKDGCSSPKLVECTGLTGLYVTLSHCWGGQQPLVTTSKNYDEHIREIPYDTLPRTFQDAVTVTRTLGYRYLWIDSLCIIQDSEDDWQAECATMEQIYENCALTIAGPDAGSPHAGFLHERPQPPVAPCVISDSNCDISLTNDLVIGISGVPYFEGASVKKWFEVSLKGPNSVMDSRAWILQERLLSPRVMFFGAKQIHYECRTTVSFECCWYPVAVESAYGDTIGYPPKQARYLAYPGERLNEDGQVRRNWCEIVEFYSNCKLSRPSDKLPALGALARRFSKEFSTQYLAGLWRGSLSKDLIWIRDPHRGPASRYHGDYIAPSWSWASINGPVFFLCESWGGIISYFICLEAQVQHAGHDQFNRISAARFVLLGHVREFAVRFDANDKSRYDLIDPDLPPSHETIGRCFVDELPARAPQTASGFAQLCFLVCAEDTRSASGVWWALAIDRCPTSRDIFYRVGVASGITDDRENLQWRKWQASEMQRITII